MASDAFGEVGFLGFGLLSTVVDWRSGVARAAEPFLRRHGLELEWSPLTEPITMVAPDGFRSGVKNVHPAESMLLDPVFYTCISRRRDKEKSRSGQSGSASTHPEIHAFAAPLWPVRARLLAEPRCLSKGISRLLLEVETYHKLTADTARRSALKYRVDH